MEELILENMYIWLVLSIFFSILAHYWFYHIADDDNPSAPNLREQFKPLHTFFNPRYGGGVLFVFLFLANIFIALFFTALSKHLFYMFSIFD